MKKYLLIVLLIVTVLGWYFLTGNAHVRSLQINFYDVGQGDAIYIRTPEGQDILIDGGPNNKILQKLGKDMPFWDRKIELIISTHSHVDHATGLREVLKRYEVDKVIEASNVLNNKVVQFGEVELDNYFEDSDDLNEASIVTQLKYKKIAILMMADRDNFLEPILKSQILKVSHHGSRFGTNNEFLDLVQPELAVISVGQKNSYGHPAPEVLQRLQEHGAKIWRTGWEGDLRCKIDGEKYQCN